MPHKKALKDYSDTNIYNTYVLVTFRVMKRKIRYGQYYIKLCIGWIA